MTVTAPTMVCTRCNSVRSDAGKCPKCGTRLQTLASMKMRGWVALVAGLFLVLLISAVWVYVGRLFSAQGVVDRDVATAQFAGRTYVAFALVLVSGLLGVANGIWQIRTGCRNRVLVFAMLVMFAAAIGVAVIGSNAYHPS
jgi:hypothetical protein